MTIKERFMEWLHVRWAMLGMKLFGYEYMLLWVPNKVSDEVMAITFSYREDYLNKIVQEIDGEYPNWKR